MKKKKIQYHWYDYFFLVIFLFHFLSALALVRFEYLIVLFIFMLFDIISKKNYRNFMGTTRWTIAFFVALGLMLWNIYQIYTSEVFPPEFFHLFFLVFLVRYMITYYMVFTGADVVISFFKSKIKQNARS